jgi:hypothetical protein
MPPQKFAPHRWQKPTTNREKTSWVWDHFEANADGRKAKCKYCHKDIRKHTGDMRKHLQSKHSLQKGSKARLAGIINYVIYLKIYLKFESDKMGLHEYKGTFLKNGRV